MQQIKRPKVYFEIGHEFSLEEFAQRVHQEIDYDNIAYFIAHLDSIYGDWDVTVKIMNHFDSLKKEMLEKSEDYNEELIPNNLLKVIR